MTLPEFFGCAFLAFGPPTAMFAFTVAHDPIRIIIFIAAAFFWLCSLLVSSVVWFVMTKLSIDFTILGLIISVLIQEAFRFIIYTILRKTEKGLEEIADSVNVSENKHILAYVSGLGFGVISGAFALVNILADSVGPATMGLKAGTDIFFITSAAQTLCFILLNTFWNVIFFHALDKKMYASVVGVVTTHLAISCLTLANSKELYLLTLLPSYLLVIATGAFAFKACGGTKLTFLRFIKCQ